MMAFVQGVLPNPMQPQLQLQLQLQSQPRPRDPDPDHNPGLHAAGVRGSIAISASAAPCSAVI